MSISGDRKIVFALLGIAVLCLIGLGGSLYHAKASELRQLQEQLAEKERELQETREKVKQLPQLEAKYEDVKERLSVLEPALPTSAYIPTFLRQIENLATGTRNEITMIRPKPVVRQSAADRAVQINDETGEVIDASKDSSASATAQKMPYEFVQIELRVQGTYWSVIEFLEELQQFPKMIAVNDISFSPSQTGATREGRGSPELTASMELTAVVTKGDSDGRAT